MLINRHISCALSTVFPADNTGTDWERCWPDRSSHMLILSSSFYRKDAIYNLATLSSLNVALPGGDTM